jgi:hypothetical protein
MSARSRYLERALRMGLAAHIDEIRSFLVRTGDLAGTASRE